MKAITQDSKGLPNNYGRFYTSLIVAILYVVDIKLKTIRAASGTLLDFIGIKNNERNSEQIGKRYKMKRTKFVQQLNLQQKIRYGVTLYIVVITAAIPASICSSSSHQSIMYEYHASTQYLIAELLKSPQELKPVQMTLAARLGMEPPSRTEDPMTPPFHSYIMQASQAYEVDSALIRAIIMVESGNNPQAVSHRGARGLMQLMPTTARWLGVEDTFDPELNIDGGVRYFKRLLDRFDGDIELALAAYNAGSRYVLKYGGVPPFRATRVYIKKVLRYQLLYDEEMALILSGLRMS